MTDADQRTPAGFAALPAWLTRGAAAAACFLLIAAAVWLFSALVVRLTVVVVPVLIALLIAAVFQPVVARLHHPRVPDWVAPLAVVLLLLAATVGFFAVTGKRVASEVPELRDQAAQLRQTINERTGIALPPLPGTGGPADTGGATGRESSGSGSTSGSSASTSNGARDAAKEALGAATEVLVGLFLTLALGFLFLKDGERMWQWFLQRTGPAIRDKVDAGGRGAWSTLATYVRGLTIVALFDAAGIAIGLVVLGVPLVLTLALLQFIGSYIPTFGAFVAGAVAVVVALVSGGLVTAALTLLLIVAVQQIGNDVIEPWVMGHTLPLHPAVVLVAVTSGAVLWGIAGALLFVPLAAAATAATHAVRMTASPDKGPAHG